MSESSPESNSPESDKPESDKPESDKPESDKPESDKPESDKPESMAQPATVERRTRTLILLGLLIGAVAGAAAASAPWWRVQVGTASATFTGAESGGGLAIVLVLVALAGILFLLAAGRVGRRIMAGLLSAVFVAMVIVGVTSSPPSDAEVRAVTQTLSVEAAWTLAPTGLAWLYAATGLLGTIAAVALLLTAGRWPDRASRYDRQPAAAARDDLEGWWRAMDAGEDPTDRRSGPQSDPDYPSAHRTGQNVSRPEEGYR